MKHKAILLDLDGTVRRTNKSGLPTPNRPEDQEVLPGRYDKIWQYKKDGYKVIAVTNQGGVGLGLIKHKDVEDCLKDLNKRLDGVFDHMYYAPEAPSKASHFTKPNPGMILKAVEDHGIDLSKSIMVGDMESDRLAAQRAGVRFQHADEFFGKPER